MHQQLIEIFEGQAEWREQKAVEYPHDARNAEAAKLFRHLSATVEDVPDSILTAAEELHEGGEDGEVWNEMLRQVGFHTAPESAEAFLRGFIAARTS